MSLLLTPSTPLSYMVFLCVHLDSLLHDKPIPLILSLLTGSPLFPNLPETHIPWSQASPEAILSDDFLFSRPCVRCWHLGQQMKAEGGVHDLTLLHASRPLLSSSVTPLGLMPSDYNAFPVFIPPSPYHCHPPGAVPCAGENAHGMPYLHDIVRPSSPFHLHYPPLQLNCSTSHCQICQPPAQPSGPLAVHLFFSLSEITKPLFPPPSPGPSSPQ